MEQALEGELWLISDCSDLRKPYVEVMPYLIQVRDLDGDLAPGYNTLRVIGLTLGQSGLFCHRLFSSYAPDFVSEPAEMQQALATLKEHKTVTWLSDSGFDDMSV
jgi:hypothetical protein